LGVLIFGFIVLGSFILGALTSPPILGFTFKPFGKLIFPPFFLPLQKLLNPFFKHCMPFLIAICLAFAAAAFFKAAAPPVFAMAAIVKPTLTIFPIFFNFLRIKTRFEETM